MKVSESVKNVIEVIGALLYAALKIAPFFIIVLLLWSLGAKIGQLLTNFVLKEVGIEYHLTFWAAFAILILLKIIADIFKKK